MSSLKNFYLDTLTLLKYGTARPSSLQPPGTPAKVFFDPADHRAVKKLIYDSVRRRTSIPVRFWRAMVNQLQPDVALDVGANYGECFASTRYPAQTRILAIEANPALLPYLAQTVAAHPCASAIRVVNCLIAERPGEPQHFYFNPKWTGGGSAVKPETLTTCKDILVPTDCLDQILAREIGPVAGKRLVLKVDVEGYEGLMFRGFETLASFETVAGIFEFDTNLLAKAGTPAEDVFARLAARFRIFDTVRHARCLRPIADWAQLVAARGAVFHTDLVILSSETLIPPDWQIVR